jgi:hemerythrin superfamily protein
MATRTKSGSSSSRPKSSSRSSGSNRSSGNTNNRSSKSAFSWGDHTGALVGAAVAGAAIGFAANFGRKFLTQAVSGISGDWDDVLSTEHDMVEALFDKALATDSSQTWKRSMLLMQISHALDKHAHEEESILYPALREANEAVTADELDTEHGYMKTHLYELGQMEADDPAWLETMRELRDLVVEHARMEENEVFPAFKDAMTEDQNAKITAMVNRDGFWMA